MIAHYDPGKIYPQGMRDAIDFRLLTAYAKTSDIYYMKKVASHCRHTERDRSGDGRRAVAAGTSFVFQSSPGHKPYYTPNIVSEIVSKSINLLLQ